LPKKHVMDWFKQLRKGFKKKHLLNLLGIVIFLALMFVILGKAGEYLEGAHMQALIKSSGVFAPLLILVLYVITIVFAPLTGFPIVVLTIAALGPLATVVINVFAIFFGGTINYYISKRYGRKVIRKLIGRGGLEKVDALVVKFDLEMLILTRLFQCFLFEWISYAAGLTKISYKAYIVITMLGSIPYLTLLYVFALKIHDLGQLYIYFTIINYALLAFPGVYYLGKRALRVSVGTLP